MLSCSQNLALNARELENKIITFTLDAIDLVQRFFEKMGIF